MDDPIATLEARVRANPVLAGLLDRFDQVDLPDAWLAAGAIAQTVWNLAAGQPAGAGIKDVDLVHFDPSDLSADAEAAAERRIRALVPEGIRVDVKNEARVHLWYAARFGYPIPPYASMADAIASFPTTATAVGVRCVEGRFEVAAPFGLDDLLGLIVRPNKRQITRAIYQAKVERWRPLWPALTVVEWDA